MTAISLNALLELALDLSHSLLADDRFERLLTHIRKAINCDAVVLLQLQGDTLKPLALQGLTPDTAGRRFLISEHPRFESICRSRTPVRFSDNSPLPDPYDGLLLALEGDLPVHSCMGLPLYHKQQLLGVLTLDSLSPRRFDDIPERTLELISAISAAALNNALALEALQQQSRHARAVVEELTQEALSKDGGEIIGDSPVMQRLKQEIETVAQSDFTALIYGETGVGKELVARTIHQQSRRHNGPLVYVNCAALPENLIESELFGHVKGAFTGASQNRAGKFSIADGGTLFLDEVGELPLAVQSKLLRALQSQEIQPVGQDKTHQVNVRIIAATNRDLSAASQTGQFRADLYHRLSVYPITVPPLRQRQQDITLLAGFFVEGIRRKLGITQLKLASEVRSYLQSYDWPGNVRELEHCISRAALRARNQSNSPMCVIQRQHMGVLQPAVDSPAPETSPVVSGGGGFSDYSSETATQGLKQATEHFQADLIGKTLQQTRGNWSAAARQLQTDRANLSRLAKRLGIQVQKQIQHKPD